jgi:hypothetical protein
MSLKLLALSLLLFTLGTSAAPQNTEPDLFTMTEAHTTMILSPIYEASQTHDGPASNFFTTSSTETLTQCSDMGKHCSTQTTSVTGTGSIVTTMPTSSDSDSAMPTSSKNITGSTMDPQSTLGVPASQHTADASATGNGAGRIAAGALGAGFFGILAGGVVLM